MEKAALAQSNLRNGYNCAQAVVKAFCNEVELDEKDAVSMATGLGGGGARNGYICGALAGAALIIGKKFGNGEAPDLYAKENVYKLVNELFDSFVQEHNTTLCKELIQVDLKSPDQFEMARASGVLDTVCPRAVETAARLLEEILND